MCCSQHRGTTSRRPCEACASGTVASSSTATNPFVETSPELVLADLGGIGASEIVLVSRDERASSRRSIPSSWPASTRGRSRAKARA
jgi:hypothetical protein